MHLVPVSARTTHTNSGSGFSGLAFSLAISDADSITALRDAGTGRIALAAPYHMSDDDAYLIVPEDIGVELVDIMRDGDHELLQEALRDGLLAVGHLERATTGMVLVVARCQTPSDALTAGLTHTEEINVTGTSDGDPVRRINQIGHVQCTTLSALVDEDGLEQILRETEYLGASWTLDPKLARRLGDVDPTYVWSRRINDDSVSIELALFSEDDEIVVLLRPLLIGG
jgi:hypothetical protein